MNEEHNARLSATVDKLLQGELCLVHLGVSLDKIFFPFLSFSFFPLSFFGCGSWVYVDIVTLDYLHIANMRSFVIRSVMALSLGYH